MNLEATDITLSGNVNITGNLVTQSNPGVTLPVSDATNVNTYVHPGAVPGTMVFNTVYNKVYVWTGTSWVALN